jgi:hypothetical protein
MDLAKNDYVKISGELNNLLNFQASTLALAVRHYLAARPDLHSKVTQEHSDAAWAEPREETYRSAQLRKRAPKRLTGLR